jgi:hypothetical protein
MAAPLPDVIVVKASQAEVMRELSRLGKLISGGASGAGGFVRAMQIRVGLAILQRIKAAFIVKARGGVDECGDRWAPLSRHTVAYTRKHPGVPRKRPFWDHHPSFAAKPAQRDRWWSLYFKFKARYGASQAGKRRAAATAWMVLRLEGKAPKTLMERYGDVKVEILRDRSILYNSITPGADADSAPLFPPRVKEQVFRPGTGQAIIGTTRKHARSHHDGIPGRIPQRRLWPEPAKWTTPWWSDALDQFRKGVVEIIVYLLGRLNRE